jgi:hypothetical protein
VKTGDAAVNPMRKRWVLFEEIGRFEGGVVDTPAGRDKDDQPSEGDGEWGAFLCDFSHDVSP